MNTGHDTFTQHVPVTLPVRAGGTPQSGSSVLIDAKGRTAGRIIRSGDGYYASVRPAKGTFDRVPTGNAHGATMAEAIEAATNEYLEAAGRA